MMNLASMLVEPPAEMSERVDVYPILYLCPNPEEVYACRGVVATALASWIAHINQLAKNGTETVFYVARTRAMTFPAAYAVSQVVWAPAETRAALDAARESAGKHATDFPRPPDVPVRLHHYYRLCGVMPPELHNDLSAEEEPEDREREGDGEMSPDPDFTPDSQESSGEDSGAESSSDSDEEKRPKKRARLSPSDSEEEQPEKQVCLAELF